MIDFWTYEQFGLVVRGRCPGRPSSFHQAGKLSESCFGGYAISVSVAFRSPSAASVGGARVEVITKTLLQKIDKKAKAISFGLASVPAKQALTKPVVDAVQAYLLARPVVSGDDNRTGGSL